MRSFAGRAIEEVFFEGSAWVRAGSSLSGIGETHAGAIGGWMYIMLKGSYVTRAVQRPDFKGPGAIRRLARGSAAGQVESCCCRSAG